jgi:hypothetical protein
MGALALLVSLAFVGGASAATVPHLVRVNPLATSKPLSGFKGISNDVVSSTNWSGYAVENTTTFSEVTGSWTEPAVTCTSNGSQYASFWAGIDGYSSASVEQLGTDSDCNGKNRPAYYAWYEMYPANSVDISTTTYPVKPGDTLTATVTVVGTSFTLKLVSSRGWTFSITKTGTGLAQSSAEMIAESPEICYGFRCQLAQLPNFGTVNFTGSEAMATGGALQPLSAFTTNGGPHEIIGQTSGGVVRMQPSSPLGNGGTSFSDTWKHS